MERNLSAYFGPQNVLDLQLFKDNFEQNNKSQHQCAVAFSGSTRVTSPRVTIRTGLKSPRISDEKEEGLEPVFNDNARMSSKIRATRVGLRHTKIFNVLNRELKH